MIQCSVCAEWFHTECVGLKKDATVGIWPCPSCRQIPKQSKRSWEFYTAKPTLLIGDSLIRNVDENKLDNTIVRSMSGATIGDVHDELSIDDKLYKKIFVCAGTNDCSKGDMNITSKWSLKKMSARFCRWHRLKWQPPMTLWLAAFLHTPIAQQRNKV